MAITRTRDIRHIHIPTIINDNSPEIKREDTPLTDAPNVKREFAKIMMCTLPLIGLLIIAYYLDTTEGWVVPFAEKMLKLGF